jgi:heme-binding NEAT domain protein
MFKRTWLLSTVIAVIAVFALPAAASAATMNPGAHARPAVIQPDYKPACTTHPAKGSAACLVLVRTNVTPYKGIKPHIIPSGYGPADLQSAYKLPTGVPTGTETVALIDAYDDPNAASDLATYRTQYSLPAANFTKVNQNGAASPLPPAAGSTGWDVEESLDIDMVSAICPLCHILLVEANSPNFSDLGTAVDSAVAAGADYVSNSYGTTDFSGESAEDTYYNHPGVAVTASAGDDGYGVGYPAASPDVTSVGGTSLTTSTNSRGWAEMVWGNGSSGPGDGTGSGCSAYEPTPPFQTSVTQCTMRADNDVSAVADPNTGVAVYDTYSEGGWLVVGGTSASSPIIASVFALAGTPSAGTYPASYIWANHSASNLFDVTSGSNGTCSPAIWCTGEVGWDGPTGWGTPDGATAFAAPVTTAPVVTGISPTSGPAAGGTVVTITGTSLSGATAVKFGTTAAASFTCSSATTCTATSPAGTGTVDVTVTTPAGTSATSSADKFTYNPAPPPAPVVTKISPTSGPAAGGTVVTVTGTNLASGTVKFGTNSATSVTCTATSCTATSPAGTGTVDVEVTTTGGTSAASSADKFTYNPAPPPAPVVTAISPTSGPAAGGTVVTITGTNLSGATAVKFGTTAAASFTCGSATSCTATSPAGTGTVDVTVTTPAGTSATSAADKFTYNPAPPPAPVVTKISPTSGPAAGGTVVTITGTNLSGATAVRFGTAAATGVTCTATSCTATSPAGTGTVDVTVTTPGGTSATSAADKFTYTTPLPTGPIKSGYAGKCADDWHRGTTNGNKIDIYSCNGTSAQQWIVEANGSLQNATNGKCIDVRHSGIANGTPVQLYQCNGTGAQVWKVSGQYLLNPHAGNKCLTARSRVNGTQLVIWTCTGLRGQKWTLP